MINQKMIFLENDDCKPWQRVRHSQKGCPGYYT